MDNNYIIALVAIISFALYNFLILRFSDQILEKRFAKKWYYPITIIPNSVLIYFGMVSPNSNSMLVYILILLILCIEFSFIYKSKFSRVFFVTSAYSLHIMTVRAICVSIISINTNLSLYYIVNNSFYLFLSTSITFMLLCIAVAVVTKMIPGELIKMINNYSEQFWFLSSWLIVFNALFIFLSRIYSTDYFHILLNQIQIATPIAVLIGLYIVVFFSLKTSALLGYKKKNDELQIQISNESQFRSSMIQDAITCYEFNLTRNVMLKGVDDLMDTDGKCIYSYSEIVEFLSPKLVYKDDVDAFSYYSSYEHFSNEFNNNRIESALEYRRITEGDNFIWVKAITSLYRDVKSGDLMGFTYIKNINNEKCSQLELKFNAERDSLTGLYNKGTTSKLVTEYLSSTSSGSLSSAVFIIDVDNFKSINDNLGHIYGDAVLCDLGEKLKNIFRDNDIVGRIGGDEFFAFLKHIKDKKTILDKASQILSAFSNTYSGADDQSYCISASVGIAVFPDNGITFEDLYKAADIALYKSKNNGKNTFVIYNNEQFQTYKSNRTEIDTNDSLPQKNFKFNKIEYIFKILYNSVNPIITLQTVLELLSKHYKFSRGYVFEFSENDKFLCNTFEWCAKGVDPQIDNLQNIDINMATHAIKSVKETGVYILKTLDNACEAERVFLEKQCIKSMLQFGIFHQKQLIGFVGFDDCFRERVPSEIEIDELTTLCNVISTFIIKQRIIESNTNYESKFK